MCRKNGVCQFIFGEHSEAPSAPTEVGGEPNKDGGKKDDCAGLLDEGPAALPHGAEHVADCRKVVCGKLHYERSGIAREHLCLLKHDTGNDDRRHTDEVCAGCNPGASRRR